MNTVTFDNGLTEAQEDMIDEIQMRLTNTVIEIEALGRHRSYALAITKLEEARHWLRDRRHKPA